MIDNVAIVSIGDELINGFTVDTNSSWIAQKICQYRAISIKSKLTISDNKNEIIDKLDHLLNQNYRFIFITGGLGPTHDDITKDALKKYFDCDLVLNDNHFLYLKNKYNHHVSSNLNLIKEQSKILTLSQPIPNKEGVALGMMIEHKNTMIFVMPGVPLEMKHMFNDYIIPNYIEEYYQFQPKYITLLTTGIYESALYKILKNTIYSNKKEFTVSFLPSYTGVKIRLGLADISASLTSFKKQVMLDIGDYVYGYNNDKIESVVSDILINKSLTLSIAESCTGGYLSKRITDIPNSSKFFIGSIVSYSNKIKNKYLDISNQVLENKGAVSAEVALLMAQNIRKRFDTDIGISTTGISGPSGGTKDKPVGRIYIAIVFRKYEIVKEFDLLPKRDKHREIAAHTAFNMLRLLIK